MLIPNNVSFVREVLFHYFAIMLLSMVSLAKQENKQITPSIRISKTKQRNAFLQCLHKWNRTIVTTLVIVTILGAFTVLALYRYHLQDQHRSSLFKPNKTAQAYELLISSSCQSEWCGATCTSVDLSNLPSEINNALNSKTDCMELSLILENINFGETLIKDWLKGVTVDLTALKITNGNFKELASGAFTQEPFKNLKRLALENSGIRKLDKNSFLGLSLTDLEINFQEDIVLDIEESTFDALSATLSLLQLQRCLADNSLNMITGATGLEMKALSRIDIRFNKLTNLKSTDFRSAPYLTTIWASSSNLRNIERDAFKELHYLSELAIDSNNLNTLPEGLLESNYINNFNFNNNPWKCNCDLLWLKEYYEISEKRGGFNCLENGNYVDYTKVKFCDEDMPTKPTTTTSTTTPQPPVQHIEVTCSTSPKTPNPSNLQQEVIDIIKLRNQTIDVVISQRDDKSYQIVFDETVKDEYLIWLNSNDKVCNGCKLLAGQNIHVIDDLNPGDTYTFCLLKMGHEEVAPFDCGGFSVPLSWNSRTWLPNDSKSYVIGGIIGGIVFAVCTTAISVFYFIRQHPAVIRGNKRVIIVESKSTDALVMPKNYNRFDYVPPSMISYSDGYLKPTALYDRVQGVGVHKNTFATKPSARLEHGYARKRVVHLRNSFEEDYYEPPPLPPNHPSTRV